MSKVVRNIASGLLGKGAASIATLIFLPLYRPLLGNEAFGLIGFSVGIGMVFTFLVTALEPVIVREVARRKARGEGIWEVLRGQEYLCGGIMLALVAFSGLLARAGVGSLTIEELDPGIAVRAIQLVLVGLALEIGGRAHFVVLYGRQEHHLCAILTAARSWGEALGGYLVLLFTGDVLGFFWCLVIVRAILTMATALMVWRPMRECFWRFRVGLAAYRGLGGFALLNLLAAALSAGIVLTTQMIVGATLSLGLLGIYNIALIPSAAAANLAGQVGYSLLPRLCELQEGGSPAASLGSLLKGVSLHSLLATPLLTCIALFAGPLFLLWQRDAGIMSDLVPIGALVAAATIFNCAKDMILRLEFMHGRMRYAILGRALHLAIAIPAAWWAAAHFGLPGLGVAFLAFSVVECFGLGFLCLRAHGKSIRFTKWAVAGIGLPVVICGLVSLAVWGLGPGFRHGIPGAVLMLAISPPLVLLASPVLRASFLDLYRSAPLLRRVRRGTQT